MNEPFKPDVEGDVVALIKKIQEHLVILERKIDALSNKSQERSFNRERNFSKPFRSFDPSRRYGKGEHGHTSREGGLFPQGQHFRKRQSDENRGFGQKKKPFFHKQKDR